MSVLKAIVIVGASAGLRAAIFSGLGRGIPYLTFYPAVMVAALFGGLWAGLLATTLAAGLAYFWIQQGHLSTIEWLAGAVFCVSCTMISFVSEAMIRAQARAKKAKEEAEAANRAKSVFLASMSHELRTPLNAILGFSQLMRQEAGVSESQQRTLGIINRSGKHLLGLINAVLDLAKIEAGGTVIANAAFNVRDMLHDIADLMRQRAEVKGLSLALDVVEEAPDAVWGDETKLRQVVLNLVGNAVKFTTRGSVTLRLRLGLSSGPDDLRLVIEVEDTGECIPAADHQRIFEPFVQLGSKSSQKGTGLGLTITAGLVQLMGGDLRLHGAPGKGTRFVVEVPVKRVQQDAVPVARSDETRLAHLAPGQPECRVLIVEDEAVNQMLLRQLLEHVGFCVQVAEDGAVGVEAFAAWHPHFIFMDWRMPVMDGLEAIGRIRKLPGGREVKIAVLSASVFKEERAQVLTAGADDFLCKPIELEEVQASLARHLAVRFVGEEPAFRVSTRISVALDRHAIAALPAPVRAELEGAIVSLEAEPIARAIRSVGHLDGALGNALEYHAGRLEYTAILRALADCRKTEVNA